MTDLLQGEKKKPFKERFFFSPCTPSSFSKPFHITFVFCPAKSESGNRQRDTPMRQQIKRRVERLPLPCPAIAFGDGGTPSSFPKPFNYRSIPIEGR